MSPFARCVLADNPSAMTYTGTNTWVLSQPGSRAAVLIDPGPSSRKHFEAVEHACQEDRLDIGAIVLTHGHPDHSEGATEASRRWGAPVFSRSHENLAEGPFQPVDAGPLFEVVYLPGHSSDSVGICFPLDRSIATGDLVFAQSPTVICWPDGTLQDYFESLRRVKALVREGSYLRLLSAHGPPVENPLTDISLAEAHRFKRLAQVRGAIHRGGTIDVEHLAQAVYDDVDARLDLATRANIQAQIDYLFAIDDPCVAGHT
ncbi:MAG: MBL fold metallo-hydrolase [Eggerthellaceae bacterium]|nr:MBL fold metallo-hydrolase [Eggerthellaceae bacterium]MDR2715477.1 MBL fold metallo-hydrolase [Coriobacteriaceae bacterium]